jgi:regulator of sigma E protease
VSETINLNDLDGNKITVPSPAFELGLKENDQIISIDGMLINTWSEISNNLSNKADSNVVVEWVSQNSIVQSGTVKLVGRPAFNGKEIINQGVLGVLGNTVHRNLNFFESIKIASTTTGNIIISSFYGFIGIISGNIPIEYMSGIVGIAGVASEEAKSGGLLGLISLMAFLSANLGLINILPIPGLDGGHALISIIEGIIRRELPVKVKYTIQFIGIFLILSLFIFTIFNDVRNIFN